MSNAFDPVPLTMLCPPDSELAAFLQEAHRLLEREPEIVARIEADLDLHGKRKKSLRLQDAEWIRSRPLGLPGVEIEAATVPPEALVLATGRPRTPAYVVYMFLVGRGYYGGFKSSGAMTLLQESTTLAVFLANQQMVMPGASTLSELTNAVSNETREFILSAQLRQILGERWDPLDTLLQDSTAVEGNTEWPKDSQLMVDLVARLMRRGSRLHEFGLTDFDEPLVEKLLGKMVSLHKQISMGTGRAGSRRERRKLYAKLLRLARKARAALEPHVARVEKEAGALDVLPSRRRMALRLTDGLRTDLRNVQRVIDACNARVLHERIVPIAEKVLSVSDPDVGFIAKGGRDPVVGYKPQLGRSGGGFVVGLILPQGNAADSDQLVPMFDQVVARTGVVPATVSVDDGYASRAGRDNLKARGVAVMSISGSKGKHITTPEEWDDLDHVAARDGRSAVESLMFTIKHGFDFGRVARRGIHNVRAELLEKVLAYNFCRMARCRRVVAESGQRLAS